MDFRRRAIVGRRQQIEHGRTAPEQLRFGRLALGQLRGVELADQPADLGLQVLAAGRCDLAGQQRAQQQDSVDHWSNSIPLLCIIRCSADHRQHERGTSLSRAKGVV